jgi:hypothetical protein
VSRRVFVNVRRGPMDNTAICIFPWEIDILQHIHMQEVAEVSIDEMANQKDGVVKVEKLKLKHTKLPAPDLRTQLEMMAYVDPEEDPANDPARSTSAWPTSTAWTRTADAGVSRIYGEFSSGAFEARLKQHAKDRQPKPSALKALDEGLDKAPTRCR